MAKLTRRAALGAIATGTIGVAAACNPLTQKPGAQVSALDADPKAWWKPGGYIVHETVDTTSLSKGRIKAFVSGEWQEFKTIELPGPFVRWSFQERIICIQRLARFGFQQKDLAGPHNACVATVGGPTRDSAISLNTAYKGMGFAPKLERLAETIELLEHEGKKADESSMGIPAHAIFAKTKVMEDLYRDVDRFDLRSQVSLELFATPDYPTHTFLNMMVNPIASASFLDFPTYEIRAIPKLLHPKNPGLTEHERLLVKWTNQVHDFIHGGEGDKMACVYHVIEVFDDTPSDRAKGVRVA